MTLRWETRIDRAEARGHFTERDVDDAHNSWRTCAIGERAAAEQLDANALIMDFFDERFVRLGIEFGNAVAEQKVARARRVWEQIQGSWARFLRKLDPETRKAYEQ